MPDYSLGFSAHIAGVDKQSLDQAVGTIKDYMARNTKLRKAFELPTVKSKGSEEALSRLNARILELKNNIATISFNTPAGLKELDVEFGKNGLKVISETRRAYSTFGNEIVNIKTKITSLHEAMSGGDNKAATKIAELNNRLIELKDNVRNVYGDAKADSLENEFGGAVLKVEETKSAIGEVTGRVISLQAEGSKVNRVFQSWNQDVGEFRTTSTRLTGDYEKIQNAVDRLSLKIKNMYERNTDLVFRKDLEGFQIGLKNIDIYADDAGDRIEELNRAVGTSSNNFSTAERELRKYAKQLADINRAQFELLKIESKQDDFMDESARQQAIESAKDNIGYLKAESQATKANIDALGRSTSARRLEEKATADQSAKTAKFITETQKSASVLKNFTSGMKDAVARVANYTIVYRVLWSLVRLFRDSIGVIQDVNKAFTDIQMVTFDTAEAIGNLQREYADLAVRMSASITDVAKGASEWLRQGKSIAETTQLLEASMVMSKIGAIESAQATEYLTSVLNGYKFAAEDAIRVVDTLSEVDVASASSVADIAEALQRSANSARLAGVEFETLVGWIAEVKEVTQRSASSLGEAFKSILSRIGSVKAGVFLDTDLEGEFDNLTDFINDTEKVLSKVGIALRTSTNDFRDAEDVIKDVAAAWGSYSDIERNAISTAMAGTRQREVFAALMENFGRATELSTVALNAEGAAMEKYNVYQGSVEASQERINALFEKFVVNLDVEDKYKTVLWFFEGLMQIASSDQITNFLKYGSAISVASIAMLKLISVTQKMETANYALRKSLEKTASSAQLVIAVAAFIAVIQILDAVIVTNKELSKSIAESEDKIKTWTSEMDSLDGKLKTTKERLEELYKIQADGGLTLVERTELETLEASNVELERQIALLKEKVRLENIDVSKKADELASRSVRVYEEDVSGPNWRTAQRGGHRDENLAQQFMTRLGKIDALKAQRDALDRESSTFASDLERITNNITILEKTNLDAIEQINQISQFATDEKVREEYKKVADSYDLIISDAQSRFAKIMSDESFKDASDKLKAAAEDGSIAAQLYSTKIKMVGNSVVSVTPEIDELVAELNKYGFTTEDIIKYTGELANGMDNLADKTGAAKVEIASFGSIIEAYGKKAELVAEAQFELSSTGLLTADTVSALEKEFGNINGILTLTENGFLTTEAALNGLMEAQRANYELIYNNASQAGAKVLDTEFGKKNAYMETTEAIKAQLIAKKQLLLFDLKQLNSFARTARKQGETVDEAFYKELWPYVQSGSGLTDPQAIRELMSEVDKSIAAIDDSKANLDNFDAITSQIGASKTKELIDKASKKGSKDKKEETEHERRIRLLEHELFLSQQLSDIYKDDVSKKEEYLEQMERQERIYRDLQNATHAEANALRKKGKKDTDEDIQKLQQAWWGYEMDRRKLASDTANYIKEINDKMIAETEDILGRLKTAINDLMDDAQNRLEKEQRGYDTQIKRLQAILTLTQEHQNATNSVRSEIRSINNELEVSKASYKYLDEKMRQTIFNDADHKKLTGKLNDIASATDRIYANYWNEISSLSEDNIYKVEEITNEFQRQYQLKKMEYDIVKAELNMVKAQTELQNVMSNRNVRMFTGGEWKWTADPKAVEDAMRNVNSAAETLEDEKIKLQQQKVQDNYARMIDNIQMQSDAAQFAYEEMTRLWRDVEKALQVPADTVESLLVEIGESSLPMLKDIISQVGNSLGTLLNALGSDKKGAEMGFSNALDKAGLSGTSGDISLGQYLENKVKWQEAMSKGDVSTAQKLNQINQKYRNDNGILADKLTSEQAGNMIKAGVYDKGGILKGMGGIKATTQDEVIFDGGLSSKILDPERSRAFLDVADGLSTMLSNADAFKNIMAAIGLAGASGNNRGSTDSHDIYLDGKFVSDMAKNDHDTITSIIRRYIPITR